MSRVVDRPQLPTVAELRALGDAVLALRQAAKLALTALEVLAVDIGSDPTRQRMAHLSANALRAALDPWGVP